MQAELVAEAGVAAAADYNRTVEIEGVSSVTVGVTHAQGSKCSRCWNFSSAGEGMQAFWYLLCKLYGHVKLHLINGLLWSVKCCV